MTTMTASPGPSPAQRPSAQGGAVPVVAIDPFKLLLKYKWILMASLIVGAAVGVAAHVALLFIYPIWRPEVLFQAYTPPAEIDEVSGSRGVDDIELEKFMATQAKLMTSDIVLRRVVEDPTLVTEAPKWCRRFMNGSRLDMTKAIIELKEEMRARPIPQTRFVQLSMGYRERNDVTAIVGLTSRKYDDVLRDQVNELSQQQRDAILSTINQFTDQVSQAQTRRDRLIQENGIGSLSNMTSETLEALRQVNQEVVKVRLDLESFSVRLKSLQEDRAKAGGPTYSDQLRDEVNNDPLVLNLTQAINQLRSDRQSLLIRGVTDLHRDVKMIDSQIEAYTKSREKELERLLDQKFAAQVDALSKAVEQLDAQEKDLLSRRDELQTKQEDLTRVQSTVQDLEEQIRELIKARTELQVKQQNLSNVTSLDSSKRMIVTQPARVPDEEAFPQLKVMIPLGIVFVFGLTLAGCVTRELLDQRVKGPSDISIIPRARVIGVIPDSAEDPGAPSVVETAFRDSPKSVTAESVRQMRAVVIKRMQQAGHRSLLVVTGNPGSGATTVIANLALACAASEMKVLLIDANMRRPAIHKVFKLSDAPGLAEVLSGTHTFEGVVQRAIGDTVHIVSAGARANRAPERLATETMASLLRQVRGTYDIVLVDVAPMGVAGDALGLANLCDASMLVIRALSEKRGMVARLRNELADCKSEHLGVLVNGVRASAGGYMRGNIKATHAYHQDA